MRRGHQEPRQPRSQGASRLGVGVAIDHVTQKNDQALRAGDAWRDGGGVKAPSKGVRPAVAAGHRDLEVARDAAGEGAELKERRRPALCRCRWHHAATLRSHWMFGTDMSAGGNAGMVPLSIPLPARGEAA